MRRALSLKLPVLLAVACGACLAASCEEKGATSVCPPPPLYQTYPLGDASPADAASFDASETQQALAAAIDAGCITAPTLFPYDAAAGAAGEAGSGNAGAGGEAGTGTGGSAGAGGSAGDQAGAAGGR